MDAVSILKSYYGSDHDPAIKKMRADGEYGEETGASVLVFQQVFHLPETGAVDFATWYEVSNIYVSVTKMS